LALSKLRKFLAVFVLIMFPFSSLPISSAATVERSIVDRPDEVSGFQIHLVYVVPKDGNDEKRDLNGQIDQWVAESQTWLQRTISHQLIFDTFQGHVDVTFLQSKYTIAELCHDNCDALYKLADEIKAQDPNLSAGKTLYFNFSEILDPSYCGWANGFGNLSLGFSKGSICDNAKTASKTGIAWPTATMVHELLHTFGVSHVCVDDSDIMIGSPECNTKSSTFGQVPITFDASHKNYSGADAAGIDVLKLPIWKDGSGSKEYAKVQETSGDKYVPKLIDGTVVVKSGSVSNNFNWSWSRAVTTYFEKATCVITSGSEQVIGTDTNYSCVFNIPANWRPGADFVVTREILVGPYSGSASISGKVARANYSVTPCTSQVCFEGGSIDLKGYCWSSGVETLVLQQLIDGQWKDLQSAKTAISETCDPEYPMQANMKINFDTKGIKIYRWLSPATNKYSVYKGKPFAILITSKNEAESGDAEIAAAQETAIQFGIEADQKEAADLKAKQDAEAKAAADKAAADLKAKQEAEDKAAAELKAQKEAAAKIALEKAAAEAKALADKAAAAKAAADREAAAKVAAEKKISITCIKGKLIKKVVAVNPKCPSGYKRK